MQSYLHELPSTYNLVMLDLVRRGRLLYKHNEGRLLVKIYFKRAGEPLELKDHDSEAGADPEGVPGTRGLPYLALPVFNFS